MVLQWFDVVAQLVYGCTDKTDFLLDRLNCNDIVLVNGLPDVTSESSWLEPLQSAELPADQWRRVRCRLPSGSLFGQQSLHWPLSPLWLPLLVWILQRGSSVSKLGQLICGANIYGLILALLLKVPDGWRFCPSLTKLQIVVHVSSFWWSSELTVLTSSYFSHHQMWLNTFLLYRNIIWACIYQASQNRKSVP